MMWARMLWLKTRVKESTRPRLAPGAVRLGQLAVAPAQAMSSAGLAWPNGRSRLWPSPEPKPSCDTTKFCTFNSCDISHPLGDRGEGIRSEDRRGGKAGVSTGRSRWSPAHIKKKQHKHQQTH